ncbi:MAG TPA: aspartate aminotransferase family protein [Deltaproteobacteria bacterium]|nr:aspartate aminotransferase family protein [Deltaproteobacteria bacterium]
METYSRLPVKLVRGKGCLVWDDTGKEYLDMVSGIAVCNLGHAHDKVVAALCEQAQHLFHCSNLYRIPQQEKLAAMLAEHSFDSRVFFCNSGAEANEAAIKLARKYCNSTGSRGARIVTFEGSFHGRTLATVAATGQGKFKKGFDPIPEGFISVPYGKIDALDAAIDDQVGAVMLEPIQGEGGINIPPAGYLQQVRKLCDEKGLLMIMDEVQTGLARTGKLFGYMHDEIEPDIMTLAKALGNGFPVGALVAKPHVAAAFTPGAHASTFGGNPLAMASGIATLEVMLEENIAQMSRERGAYLMDLLNELKGSHPSITDVRGRGLMIGVDFDSDIAALNTAGLEKGILLNVIQGHILRVAPPLVISKAQIDIAIEKLHAILVEKGL